jgi:RNA polymerase sigma-70 factor (ECF subfamily)
MDSADQIDDVALKVLSAKIASGDQQSFRRLFDQFSSRLTAFANSMLHSRHAATEVADDVLVRIWKNRERLNEIGNLRIYLYAATKNTALNYISRQARQMITEPFDNVHVELQQEQSPEQQMITQEIFKKIRAAVDDLPPRCKMIFKLVREDGLKYKEVATILHISVNTVDAQMVIAVRKIKEAVGVYFNTVPTPIERKTK